MKRFFLNLLCVCILAIGLAGCNSTIDSVKNGTLNFDQSTTIGNALDNYSYFKKTSWKEIHTKQKQVFVEFEGIVDLTKLFADYDAFKDIIGNNNESSYTKTQVSQAHNDFRKIRLDVLHNVDEGTRKRIKEFDIYKLNFSLVIQFKINKDESFEISYIGYKLNEEEKVFYSVKAVDELINIYRDKPLNAMATVLRTTIF